MRNRLSVAILSLSFSLTAPATAHELKPLSAETVSARQKFFGLDNVNPSTGALRRDRVILSWTGVSSFAASFRGHVVFLDAYIVREGGAPLPTSPWPSIRYIGSTPEELAALKPELILFGHATSTTREIFRQSSGPIRMLSSSAPQSTAGTSTKKSKMSRSVAYRLSRAAPIWQRSGSLAKSCSQEWASPQ